MSIVKMRKMVRKQIKLSLFGRTFELGSPLAIIFWLFVIIFIVGTYYMYGPGMGGGGPVGGRASRDVSPVVATVDGHELSRSEYDTRLYFAKQGRPSDLMRMAGLKTMVLDILIDRELLEEAAKAQGIRVTSEDIEAKKDEMVEDTINSRYSDQRTLHSILEERDMSLEEFKREIRTERLPNMVPPGTSLDEELRSELAREKLREKLESAVTLSDEELRQSFEEVKARHIMIDPQRILAEATAEEAGEETPDAGPEAQEDPEAESSMTLEQAQAKAREKLLALKQKAQQGADFAELAKEHSDAFSAQQGGDLGWFTRDRMLPDLAFQRVPEFTKAAFDLKEGEISDPVESPMGLHIIKVEGRRLELPENFEESKEQYRQQLLVQRRQDAWKDFRQQLRERAEIEIIDPELQAYKMLEKDPERHAAQAAELLATAFKQDPYNASAAFELAMLLKRGDQPGKAIQVLTKLLETEEARAQQSPEVHLHLGLLLKEVGRTEQAIERLQAASEWAQGFDRMNRAIHGQLKAVYEELERTELAQKEQQWLDEYEESMQSQSQMPITIPESGG
ncbi:MAG: peptidylprolyl isomerase [Armatimonadota bacterium]|nr:peptidylprolyl isomerase [Armatimonadota bacterium]